jgi:broad specificity phosphatase PhoE
MQKQEKEMLTLFYSPHMTSVDNEAGRASGHADAPLSVLGRQLAQELGQHYATETLDAIFCSDLQRRSVAGAEISGESGIITTYPRSACSTFRTPSDLLIIFLR